MLHHLKYFFLDQYLFRMMELNIVEKVKLKYMPLSFYLMKNSDVTFCALLDYPLSGIMIELVAGLLPGKYLLARNSVNWTGNIF